jgi:hypothetical protein
MKLSKLFLFTLFVLPAAIFAKDDQMVTYDFKTGEIIQVSSKVSLECQRQSENTFEKCEKDRKYFMNDSESDREVCKQIDVDHFLQCLKAAQKSVAAQADEKHVHGKNCKHAHSSLPLKK